MDRWSQQIEVYCLRPAVQEALDIRGPVRTAFLAQGEYNINYLVTEADPKAARPRQAVFRLNTASQLQLENQIAYEYGALEALAPSGVTPKPLWLDDTRGAFPYGLLCMEYLPGRPLDYSRDLHHAARLFAVLHGQDTAPFQGRLIEERGLCRARVAEGHRWLADYAGCPQASATVLKLLTRLGDTCSQRAPEADAFFEAEPWTVVNNTEVNSHNFIIGPERQYVIDWEKPVLSDPVQDITQFLAPTTTLWRTETVLTEEALEHFYSQYDRFSGRGEGLRERVAVYSPFLYLRALSWCAHAWVAYQGEDRAIRNPRTYRKICQYLQEDFMVPLLKSWV